MEGSGKREERICWQVCLHGFRALTLVRAFKDRDEPGGLASLSPVHMHTHTQPPPHTRARVNLPSSDPPNTRVGSVDPAFVRQETSGRGAGDHVARGLVAAAFQQPLGPVAHDGQGEAEETQHGGREGQQTGQQTGPYAHRVLAVVRVVSRGTCGEQRSRNRRVKRAGTSL